jgi:hypothetical protein
LLVALLAAVAVLLINAVLAVVLAAERNNPGLFRRLMVQGSVVRENVEF